MAAPALDDFSGRRALIAGAAGGIGAATVCAFAEAGVDVIAVDRKPFEADTGIDCRTCDVTSEADVADLMAQSDQDGAGLDILVNAAGLARTSVLAETSLDDWRDGIDVNLTSCFLLARAAYPLLAKQHGAVVFCGSSNGVNGGSRLSGAAYAAAKAGVHNLVRYLAKEWADDGIRVNAVAPGPVDTKMVHRLGDETRADLRQRIPLKREGTPDEIAANIVFLCSRHAAWQTGTIVNISGGLVL